MPSDVVTLRALAHRTEFTKAPCWASSQPRSATGVATRSSLGLSGSQLAGGPRRAGLPPRQPAPVRRPRAVRQHSTPHRAPSRKWSSRKFSTPRRGIEVRKAGLGAIGRVDEDARGAGVPGCGDETDSVRRHHHQQVLGEGIEARVLGVGCAAVQLAQAIAGRDHRWGRPVEVA